MEPAVDFRRRVRPLATLAALAGTAIVGITGIAALLLAYVAVPELPRPQSPTGVSFAAAGAILLALVYFALHGAVMTWMRPVWKLARDLSAIVSVQSVRVRGQLFPFRIALELETSDGVVSVEGRSRAASRLAVLVLHGAKRHEVGAVRDLPAGAAQAAASALGLTTAPSRSPEAPGP